MLCLEVNINKYNPLYGSSYICLPKSIQNKKAIINVENNDQACFFWSILSAICKPNGDPQRTSSYQFYEEVLNTQGIEIPVKLSDIPKFERQNGISINVFTLDCDNKFRVVGPVHHTEKRQSKHVNLLILADINDNTHYMWIKNFSRLISAQISKRNGAKHFCDGCLQYFYKECNLKRHQQFDCNHVYTRLPSKQPKKNKFGGIIHENILKFQSYEKKCHYHGLFIAI